MCSLIFPKDDTLKLKAYFQRGPCEHININILIEILARQSTYFVYPCIWIKITSLHSKTHLI